MWDIAINSPSLELIQTRDVWKSASECVVVQISADFWESDWTETTLHSQKAKVHKQIDLSGHGVVEHIVLETQVDHARHVAYCRGNLAGESVFGQHPVIAHVC